MAPRFELSAVVHLVTRDDTPESGAANQKKLTPTLIVGIVIAIALVLGLAIWLVVRALRKRGTAQREEERGAAFLNVRGLMKEGDQKSYGLAMKGNLFSKEQMTESVILPEKAVIRSTGADAKQEILEHYTAEGKLPRPFAPFMGSLDKLSVSASDDSSSRRQSTASWISLPRNSFLMPSNRTSARSSVISTVSSIGSSKVGDKRKIRQVFNPVLPDELVISLGEQLTVVNSFDDGWCIVGRDSVFKPGDVELGAIPAWCFMKPVQGLRAERPMRTTSLGVTVTLDAAEPGARNDVMSWSNF